MIGPGQTLIVGVEDDPDEPGLLRVYIQARSLWRYVLVSDPAEQERVRRAWGSSRHLFMPSPDGFYTDEERYENRLQVRDAPAGGGV